MCMADQQSLLKEAMALAKAGQRQESYEKIKVVLKDSPNNPNALWMLANVASNKAERIKALETLLKLQPDHEKAQALLEKLGGETVKPTSAKSGGNRGLMIGGAVVAVAIVGAVAFAVLSSSRQSAQDTTLSPTIIATQVNDVPTAEVAAVATTSPNTEPTTAPIAIATSAPEVAAVQPIESIPATPTSFFGAGQVMNSANVSQLQRLTTIADDVDAQDDDKTVFSLLKNAHYSPDSHWLALEVQDAEGYYLTLLDADTLVEKARFLYGSLASFTPDSSQLIYVNSSTKINRYELASASETSIDIGNIVRDYRITPDQRLAVLQVVSDDLVEVWDMGAGSKAGSLTIQQRPAVVEQIELSPDGKIAYVFLSGDCIAFDMTTGEELQRVPTVAHAMTPNGSYFLGVSGGYWLYDTQAATLITEPPGLKLDWAEQHTPNSVVNYRFSPDAQFAAGYDQSWFQVFVLGIASPPAPVIDMVVPLGQNDNENFRNFVFTPDSKILIVPTSSELAFYDVLTGAQLYSLPSSAAFKPRIAALPRPDGKQMIVQTNDEISMWGIPSA
jgi:hypothetical protein